MVKILTKPVNLPNLNTIGSAFLISTKVFCHPQNIYLTLSGVAILYYIYGE